MFLGPVCWAWKYTISKKFFPLEAEDEKNLINLECISKQNFLTLSSHCDTLLC